MNGENYINPIAERYCSEQIVRLFGPLYRARLWRKLWVALAESQRELGLSITKQQVDDLIRHADSIDFDEINLQEKRVRHDVMAHILSYGKVATSAAPIIHLGATSCFVTDNSDIIIYKEALNILLHKLLLCIDRLKLFCVQYKDLPTLGWTHLQPAQLTTVGKRACMWLQDIVDDVCSVEHLLSTLRLRGVKGATGTQASFLELFEGNHDKVQELEQRVAIKMGFDKVYSISGQTYSRKLDYNILSVLSQIAQSASKMGTDIRLLMSIKEIEEPYEDGQIGSSAMAYKRNPMRCERMCGIARFCMSLPANASMTASSQWLERTLDDSSNRRIVMAQGFMAIDAVLNLYLDVVKGLVVYPKIVARNIEKELPFMVTESIIMQGVKLGGDRQVLHEAIRVHSMATIKAIKQEGRDNDLIARLQVDKLFDKIDMNTVLDASRYTGRASQQVESFIKDTVEPLLSRYGDTAGSVVESKVSI